MEKYLVTAAVTSLLWFFILIKQKLKLEVEKLNLDSELRKLRWEYEDLIIEYHNFVVKFADSHYKSATSTAVDKAYETLGLSKSASIQEIKNKYKMLVKKYHPDRYKDDPTNRRFKEINSAYTIIRDKLGI